MRKEIEDNLRKSIPRFVTKVDSIKETATWQIEGKEQDGKEGPYSKSTILKNGVRKQVNEEPAQIVGDLLEHYEEMDKLIPMCSSPRGFKEAWDTRSNGQDISKYDIQEIVALGGQAQLENRDTSEVMVLQKVYFQLKDKVRCILEEERTKNLSSMFVITKIKITSMMIV